MRILALVWNISAFIVLVAFGVAVEKGTDPVAWVLWAGIAGAPVSAVWAIWFANDASGWLSNWMKRKALEEQVKLLEAQRKIDAMNGSK